VEQSFEHEFGFELEVCQWAEQHWPPGETRTREYLVARQLGTHSRRWDTILIETRGAALQKRARFGEQELDSDALHVVRNAPAEWAWYRDALPHPGYPWQYVREAVHDAAERGLVEKRRVGNKVELRRRWVYPDWADRIIAIENKPDLDATAARRLASQLEQDVALGLADEVWVATRATTAAVEPVLLKTLPVEAGVLTVDSGEQLTASVEWFPRALDPDEPGTSITDRPSGGNFDQSAAQFEYVSSSEKAERRRVIAERAYGRGWRSYIDSMRPDCRHFELATAGDRELPYCRAKEHTPSSRECGRRCEHCEPEPPAWRQRGWPLEGGPGACLQRVLDARRSRKR